MLWYSFFYHTDLVSEIAAKSRKSKVCRVIKMETKANSEYQSEYSSFSSCNVLEFKFDQIPEKKRSRVKYFEKNFKVLVLFYFTKLDWFSINNFLIPFGNECINSWN